MKYLITPYSIWELGKRQNQEDSLFPSHGMSTAGDRLFILCDGMGGHAKGEVASATVCAEMSKYILNRWNAEQPLPDYLITDALNAALDVLDGLDTGEAKKMGTTMTFLCFHKDGVTVAHIGDSRVYQLRPAQGNQPAKVLFRTRDHSLVNDLVAVGEITEEEAKTHPQKNVITRAIQPNQPTRPRADIKHITDVRPGDYFYMCSDGMLEQTSDDNLLYIITTPDRTDNDKVEMLKEVTVDNSDNHTAHLIKVIEVTDIPAPAPAQTQPKAQVNTIKTAHVQAQAQSQHKDIKSDKTKLILAAAVVVLAVVVALLLFTGKSDGNKADDKSCNTPIEQTTGGQNAGQKSSGQKQQDQGQKQGMQEEKHQGTQETSQDEESQQEQSADESKQSGISINQIRKNFEKVMNKNRNK